VEWKEEETQQPTFYLREKYPSRPSNYVQPFVRPCFARSFSEPHLMAVSASIDENEELLVVKKRCLPQDSLTLQTQMISPQVSPPTGFVPSPSTATTLVTISPYPPFTPQTDKLVPVSNPSFYKRKLPDSCIAFQSTAGRMIFESALKGPHMASFFPLSMQYLTQSEPAYCGLASLAMVLNALEVDPLRGWKGCWRWFDENTLEFAGDLEKVKKEGINLIEFESTARCNGLDTTVIYADEA
jgi:hypothetical protein